MKWEDVNFAERVLTVSESKNGEYRKIDLTESFCRSLEELKLRSSSEYVFTDKKGNPYKSRTRWKTVWSNIRKKSGINIRFYDLRHTFLTNLSVELKEDPSTVMEIAGHKDIRMFLRYNHTNKEAKRNAINKLEKHLDLANSSQKSVKNDFLQIASNNQEA